MSEVRSPGGEGGSNPPDGLVTGPDGVVRCWWGGSTPEYSRYHDAEWGRPVTSDVGLFEHLCLEGFQSGLSWVTILRKREAFRAAFAGFSIDAVAAFGPDDVARLLADARIVRNRAKILAAIENAKRARGVVEELGSLAALIWSFRPPPRPPPRSPTEMPATTAESAALARELQRRGFRFVGPTTIYALMQACGLVNDHLAGCAVRPEVAEAQARALTVGRQSFR